MRAPFYTQGAFDLPTMLALAVLLGLGFGWALERAGFGSAPRLVAQFYLTDLRVLKVMFTAIVTAMVGLFGLSRLGWLDLELVWVNPTYLWPQLVGGFVLGLGFVMSGYCPGTSIVAMASGRVDGLLTLLGVAGGIGLFGGLYGETLARFHEAGAHGRWMLSDLLGLPPLVVVLLVVAMAGLAFWGAEVLERRAQARPGARGPAWKAPLPLVAGLGLVALAFLAVPPAPPEATAWQPVRREMTPMELAQLLVEGWAPVEVLVLDPKAPRDSLPPRAHFLSPEDLRRAETWEERFPPGRLYVLVTDDPESLRVPEGYRALRLRGGVRAWARAMLRPPQPQGGVPPADFLRRAAMVSYWSGTKLEAPALPAAPPPPKVVRGRKRRAEGGC
jgi:hypothetical protein